MMNNGPSFHSDNSHTTGKKPAGVWGGIWQALIHNWGWKLACLALAVILWGSVISQDTTLTREKVFTDVEITVNNASTLQRNGYIVTSGLEKLSGVTIKAEVPQRNYQTATAANYNLRVDLSTIRGTGEQTLQVLSSSSAAYGAVTEKSVDEITVTVEEYVTRSRIPVRVEATGAAPDGYYASANVSADPDYVAVSGPKSKVETIVRCVAHYDLSALSSQAGTEVTAVPFVLQDANQQTVDGADLTVSSNAVTLDSITVEQTLYPLVRQELNQVGVVKGKPGKGYEIKSVTFSPAEIDVAVRDTDSFVSDLAYLAGQVDVSGLQESTTAILTINRPGDVIYMSTDVVYVTVEIGSVENAE
ncbi:MAG: CdaR family protein [Clostridiales bacterium]|nr:CdaR family protein [Clostridiales bacterium]